MDNQIRSSFNLDRGLRIPYVGLHFLQKAENLLYSLNNITLASLYNNMILNKRINGENGNLYILFFCIDNWVSTDYEIVQIRAATIRRLI